MSCVSVIMENHTGCIKLLQSSNFNFDIRTSNAGLKSEDQELVKKSLIVRLYEFFPALKKREDYSLFLFPQGNK